MKKHLINQLISLLRILTLTVGIIYLKDRNMTAIATAIVFNVLSICMDALNKKKKLGFSKIDSLYYNIFILSATFLGAGIDLYKKLYWWDILVHFLSGVFFTKAGFVVCRKLRIPNKNLKFIAFLIVVLSALSWEVIEFFIDSAFKTNLQEWQNMAKEPLIRYVKERGHGLVDSMTDMIYAVIGYLITIKKF